MVYFLYVVKDCGIPGSISVGTGDVSYSGTEFGDIAVYHCNSGFVITGDSVRLCQDNSIWSGSVPLCTPEGQ